METLNVKVTTDNNTLIVREGEAAKIYEPRLVPFFGDIRAPGEYLAKRWTPEIEALKDQTHVIVDKEGLSILLVVNETSHHAVNVTGKLEFFKEFLSFQINRKSSFTIQALYAALRLKRAYFKNREQHALILDQLKKFEANTETQFKNTNDFKGSVAMQKIEICKTNLTYNFSLSIPVFKGLPALDFPVEIEFEPHDGSIVCWLVSDDLAELEITVRDGIIEEQVELFKEKRLVVIHK